MHFHQENTVHGYIMALEVQYIGSYSHLFFNQNIEQTDFSVPWKKNIHA